ncbi:hypothetical protein AMECASPLE_032744 [Ameca splendens]|uniref:Uncharacterized protein n=1 Tax=Ameca splendens TaxID=208324 RepID=A0ABV0XJP9_9TELE
MSSSTYLGPGCGSSRNIMTFLTADTSFSSSGESSRRSQASHSSVSCAVPWASSQWDVTGTDPKGSVQEASGIDARATSTGSSRCGGAAALLQAPHGWPSSSSYL